MPRYENKQEYFEDLSKGKTIQADCEECSGEKEHFIVASYTDKGQQMLMDEGYGVWWENEYQIIQCRGCKSISFRTRTYFSEDDFDETDPHRIYLYPERKWSDKQTIETIFVPRPVSFIYKEVIKTYNNNCLVLCAIGLRALVEAICNVLKIEGAYVTNKKGEKILKTDLEGKINGLIEKQYLTPHAGVILHTHRFMGNGAAHEIKNFEKKDLLTAIEIIEHCMQHIFILPHKGRSLPDFEDKTRKI